MRRWCDVQVMGCLGLMRRRTLLLWQALELGRALPPPGQPPANAPSGPSPPAVDRWELLQLASAALLPPEELVEGMGSMQGQALDAAPPAAAGALHREGSGNALQRLQSASSGKLRADGPAHQQQQQQQQQQLRRHFAQLAAHSGLPAARGAAWLPPPVRLSPPAPPGGAAGGSGGGGRHLAAAAAWAAAAGGAGLGPGPWGVWEAVRLGLLEASLTAARQAGLGADVWEAAAALLRCKRCASRRASGLPDACRSLL